MATKKTAPKKKTTVKKTTAKKKGIGWAMKGGSLAAYQRFIKKDTHVSAAQTRIDECEKKLKDLKKRKGLAVKVAQKRWAKFRDASTKE